jgi:cation diffusion facilitator CzcD-associated flavoprotein CzcO
MLPYAGRMPRGHQRGGLVASDARVAVVGLGAGGIAAVLGLRNAGFSNLTVFEAAACAGGTWAYSPNAHSAHSSMYESLRCNIPKESMCFVGRPLHAGADSFVGHRNVASYLQRIAAEENILPVVRFNSPVARVEPVDPQGFLTGWAVQTWVGAGADATAEGGARAVSDVEHFDAIVVCNGHFTGAYRTARRPRSRLAKWCVALT